MPSVPLNFEVGRFPFLISNLLLNISEYQYHKTNMWVSQVVILNSVLTSIKMQNRFTSNILHGMSLLVYSLEKIWKRSMQVKRSMHKSYFTEVMLWKGSKVNHMPVQKICPPGDHDLHAVLIFGGIEITREDVVFEDGCLFMFWHTKKINKHSTIRSSSNKYSAFWYLIPKHS